MVKENKVLMKEARESLSGKWGLAVGGFFVVIVISLVASLMEGFGQIVSLLITGPISLGVAIFALSIARGQDTKIEQVFHGFSHFIKALGAYLLVLLYVILWSILLIIPGVIAAFSYSMVFYILADNNSIKVTDALKQSKEMMKGYKWKLFFLSLRFIGWALLCVLTLGIGYLWLAPYMNVSFAKFYDDIKTQSNTQNQKLDFPEAPNVQS